jgi:hypothetical protein
MASNIDILLDKSSGLLLGGSAPAGALPSLTRNDVYPFRIRVLERNADGSYTDANLSSPSFSLGIGNIDAVATDGQFKLTTTTGTSTAISFNATTAQVLSAISAIAGNVSVTTYGDTGSAWIITAATANTALSFGALPFTLFPTANVQVNTRRVPTASVFAQQIVSLSRNPAVFSSSFTPVSGDGITLTQIQEGSASLNETYALSIGNDVYGGSYTLAYGGYSVGIPYDQNATNVTTMLSAITGIGAGNISVVSDSKRGLIISFVNALGLQNVSTALTLDASGVKIYDWYTATVTMSTSELEELFNEAGEDTITPTLEIEMTESGQAKTLLQYTTSISKDLILTGALVPADLALYYTQAQSNTLFPSKTSISASYYTKTEGDARYTTNTAISGSYYTKTEGDARYTTNTAISGSYYTKTESTNLFIQNTTGNVNATCRSLINSAAVTIFNYETGLIGYSGALQVPTSLASAITIQTNLSVSGSGSFNAICSSSITAYSINVVSSATISGNLTVIGAISASSLSFNTASFVLDSPLNVNASGRSLNNGATTKLSYGSNILIYPDLYCVSNVSVCGGLLVHDNSSFLSSVIINPELTVRDNINIVCGGLSCVSGSISALGINVGTGGINNSGNELISGNLVVCGNVSFNSVCLINTLSVSSVSSYQMSAITITTTALSAGTISTSCLNVTSGFRFGSVSGGACTYGVYTISSNIPNLTSITWQALNVCSNGNPATMYVLSGGATAPTFSIGYDNDLRQVVRNVLTAFGKPHFGFLNVTT